MLRMRALGADARFSFFVDRLSWWWFTGFLVFVLDERLREFASVYECVVMSEL